MAEAYAEELEVALRAVHRASIATKKISKQKDKGVSDKSDRSPVTIGDFAAQALLICAVQSAFPGDGFVAEEASDMLRADPTLLQRVWDLVISMDELDDLPIPQSKEQMMAYIDMGGSHGDESSKSGPLLDRTWVLDPIDGTKTFARNQQYAVCLCLLEDGKQKVAVLGCPNLRIEDQRVEESLVDVEGNGLMLAAVAGNGAFSCPLNEFSQPSTRRRLPLFQTTHIDRRHLRFLDSKSSGNVSHTAHHEIYTRFNYARDFWPPDLWAMQMKYVALALGAADAAFRISPLPEFRAAIWDHAGGQLILEEAGGVVTDSSGDRFDFATSFWNKNGRTFKNNRGYVAATTPELHEMILKEVKGVVAEKAGLDQ